MTSTSVSRALGAAVALLLVGLGIMLGRLTASSSPAPMGKPSPGAITGSATLGLMVGAGPSRVVAGVPVGFPRSEAGAMAAAANYAAVIGSPLSLSDRSMDALVTTIAAPGQQQVLRAKLGEAAQSPLLATIVRDADRGEPYALRTVPLGLKIEGTYSPVQVTVRVYSVTYLAASEGLASAGYGLGRYQLRWAGDWKLVQQEEKPQVGPIPSGYFAPSTGWQPSNGQNLDAVANSVRDGLTGAVPVYAVR